VSAKSGEDVAAVTPASREPRAAPGTGGVAEGSEGARGEQVAARALQHGRAMSRGPEERAHQARLSDARFAGDEHDGASAPRRALQRAFQHFELTVAFEQHSNNLGGPPRPEWAGHADVARRRDS
jgi:hypothetical protein